MITLSTVDWLDQSPVSYPYLKGDVPYPLLPDSPMRSRRRKIPSTFSTGSIRVNEVFGQEILREIPLSLRSVCNTFGCSLAPKEPIIESTWLEDHLHQLGI
jgi:hypothetical protein